VVVPRAEDLVRDERPLPLTEMRLPSPTPGLTPSLPEPETDPEVQIPPSPKRGSVWRIQRDELDEEAPVVNNTPEHHPWNLIVHQ